MDVIFGPAPARHENHAEYWRGLDEGRLLVQVCSACSLPRHPPRVLCPGCLSPEAEWVDAPHEGSLYTWVVVHHSALAHFRDSLPYAAGLIELTLTGGTIKMAGQILGGAPGSLTVGQQVTLALRRGPDGATLACWEAAG